MPGRMVFVCLVALMPRLTVIDAVASRNPGAADKFDIVVAVVLLSLGSRSDNPENDKCRQNR